MAWFFTNVRDTNRESTILFVGHLFHDCNRTFGPGLRQTETNECAKRIPDRAATTSNCTPPPLLISLSSSGFFSSSLYPRLVLFSRHLLHAILPVFLPTVIHPLICRRLTIVKRPPVLTVGFRIPIPRDFHRTLPETRNIAWRLYEWSSKKALRNIAAILKIGLEIEILVPDRWFI